MIIYFSWAEILPGMQERLDYLGALWQQKIRAQALIFFNGRAATGPFMKSAEKLKTLIKNHPKITTEYELLKLLYEHIYAPLFAITPAYINTPNRIINNKMYRATTPDTLFCVVKKNLFLEAAWL